MCYSSFASALWLLLHIYLEEKIHSGMTYITKMEPNEELIENLASQYAEKYETRYQKVAKNAFKEGVLRVLNDLLLE